MEDADPQNAASFVSAWNSAHLVDQTSSRFHSGFMGCQRRCLLKLKRLPPAHPPRLSWHFPAKLVTSLCIFIYFGTKPKTKCYHLLMRADLKTLIPVGSLLFKNAPIPAYLLPKPTSSLKCSNQSEGRAEGSEPITFEGGKGAEPGSFVRPTFRSEL